ncbi:MAG: aldose epimerase family protein [Pseudomonadota bacterium]
MSAHSRPFGTTAEGQPVRACTIGQGPLQVTILTWGAVLQDVRLAGVAHGLTLGTNDLAGYEAGMISFGALMGPVANRIRDARAPIAGNIHHFEANLAGKHTLHGGSEGTQGRVWDLVAQGPDQVTLATELPDGLSGFPGQRRLEATYRVTGCDLDLEITGTTDVPTLMNIANHSYWNLDGTDRIDGHRLQVHAARYTKSDEDLIVTGALGEVPGTPLDFTEPRPFAPGPERRYDLNYVLSPARRDLSPACRLVGASGIAMEMFTTEPGLQVFDLGTFDTAPYAVHSGRIAPRFSAIALEAQVWPDAANHAGFPSIEVTPDAPYRQHTRWRFTAP